MTIDDLAQHTHQVEFAGPQIAEFWAMMDAAGRPEFGQPWRAKALAVVGHRPNFLDEINRIGIGSFAGFRWMIETHPHCLYPPLPRANWWQRWRNQIMFAWMRTFPSKRQREMAAALRGACQLEPEIAEQYRQGQMGRDVGFDWFDEKPK